MDIFVGSLPFKLTREQLKELFEKHGEVVSVKIIINKATRQNKGFAFVVMPNDAQALKAIKALNGLEILGRNIIVSETDDRAEVKRKPTAAARPARPVGRPKRPISTSKESEGVIARKKFFTTTKKKKPVVTFGDQDGPPKKYQPRKKAKNFKVGARRKK